MYITRNDFFDIFVAGNIGILKGERFLSLPLSTFNTFSVNGSGRINLYHLFVPLAMFSVGIAEAKIRTWYYHNHSGWHCAKRETTLI